MSYTEWNTRETTYTRQINLVLPDLNNLIGGIRQSAGLEPVDWTTFTPLPIVRTVDLLSGAVYPAGELVDTVFKLASVTDGPWTIALAITNAKPVTHFAPLPSFETFRANIWVLASLDFSTMRNVTVEACELKVEIAEPSEILSPFNDKDRRYFPPSGSGILKEGGNAMGYALEYASFMRPLYTLASGGVSDATVSIIINSKRTENRVSLLRGVSPDTLNRDILDLITPNLNLRDLASLSACSRTLRDILKPLPCKRLQNTFKPYFSSPSAFADCLQLCGAVVGGSTALSVACPGPWAPDDLDIVVEQGQCRALIAYFESEGYLMDMERLDNGTMDRGTYPDVVQFEFNYCCFRRQRDNRKIDLLRLLDKTMRPFDFILAYHSTSVMNFYDGRNLFVLFPTLTFNGLFALNKNTPTARMDIGIAKYIQRGYTEWRTPKDKIRYIQRELHLDQTDRFELSDIKRFAPIWQVEARP